MKERCTLCRVDPVAWEVVLTLPRKGKMNPRWAKGLTGRVTERVCDVCLEFLRDPQWQYLAPVVKPTEPRDVDEVEFDTGLVQEGIDAWLLPKLVQRPYDEDLRRKLFRWALVREHYYRADDGEKVWGALADALIRAIKREPQRLLRWRGKLAEILNAENEGLRMFPPLGWEEHAWSTFVDHVLNVFRAKDPMAQDPALVERFLRHLTAFWW